MAVTNICPYCGGEMRRGALPAGRDSIRWDPRGEDGKVQDAWGCGGDVLLSRAGLIVGQDAEAYYCEHCGVVIVPVPEIETIGDKIDKVGEKLDAFLNRQEEKRAARDEAKAREQREKERKRRGEKDPWEV